MAEDRRKALQLLEEGQRQGVSIKAIADLIGICSRTLRRWVVISVLRDLALIAAGGLHVKWPID